MFMLPFRTLESHYGEPYMFCLALCFSSSFRFFFFLAAVAVHRFLPNYHVLEQLCGHVLDHVLRLLVCDLGCVSDYISRLVLKNVLSRGCPISRSQSTGGS